MEAGAGGEGEAVSGQGWRQGEEGEKDHLPPLPVPNCACVQLLLTEGKKTETETLRAKKAAAREKKASAKPVERTGSGIVEDYVDSDEEVMLIMLLVCL